MTDNVAECREKLKEVLENITPRTIVSDDTFLEKVGSYLTFSGNYNFLISVTHSKFHNYL